LVSRQNADQPETRRNYEVRASNNADMSTYVVLATTGSTAFAHHGTWSAAAGSADIDYLAKVPYRSLGR
jgi:hypothetical protein